MYRVHADPTFNVTDAVVETRTLTATADWDLYFRDDVMIRVDQVTAVGGVAADAGGGPVAIHRQSLLLDFTAPVRDTPGLASPAVLVDQRQNTGAEAPRGWLVSPRSGRLARTPLR